MRKNTLMGRSRQRAGSRKLRLTFRIFISTMTSCLVALTFFIISGGGATATAASAGSKPVRSVPVRPNAPVPAGFANWNQVWAYQARLNAGAERILAAGGAGNASIVADPIRHHRLRVYWHGTVPAAVRTTARHLGVPVTFRPAAFTHRELVTEARRLAGTGRVVSAAPATDGSGVAVTVDGALGPAARSSLRAKSRIPLFITRGTRLRATSTRQADTVPFWGGSLYLTNFGQCTNGIPVMLGSVAYMMTAGHCRTEGGGPSVLIPGQTFPTGNFSNVSACRDTALINYPGTIDSRIYTGPFDTSTVNNAQIGGVTPDFVGNLIVTGGASSGEHFGIAVTKTDDFESSVGGASCDPVGPLTEAFSTSNSCVQAPGDSGGPVYSYTDNGTVLARGTITGGNSGTPCPGNVATGGFEVIYAPLVRPRGDTNIGSLSFYGAVLLGVPALHSGTWNDGPGRPAGPVISVSGRAITVDMSRFNRPTAHGTIIDQTHISVTFPDDRTYTGDLLGPDTIIWSNNSEWLKL